MFEFKDTTNKEEFEELKASLGKNITCDSCKHFVFGRKCARTGKEVSLDYDLYINPYLCPSFWSCCQDAKDFVLKKELRFEKCDKFEECLRELRDTNLEIWMKCRFCEEYRTN